MTSRTLSIRCEETPSWKQSPSTSRSCWLSHSQQWIKYPFCSSVTLCCSLQGAQQGDPLGPLYFCLAFKELLESRLSELVLGFLNDVAIGGDAACVMEDFLQLEADAKQLGLEMNRDKCEIFGHSDNTRSLFASHGIKLLETSPAEVILLGAQLSAGQHIDADFQRS